MKAHRIDRDVLTRARKSRRSSAEKIELMEPIDERLVYPLPLFRRHTGIGPAAFALLEKEGLKVHKVGNRKFVRGCDWAAFLAGRGQ